MQQEGSEDKKTQSTNEQNELANQQYLSSEWQIPKKAVYFFEEKFRVGINKLTYVIPLSLFVLMRILGQVGKQFKRLYVYQQDLVHIEYYIEFSKRVKVKEEELEINPKLYEILKLEQFNKEGDFYQELRYQNTPKFLWLKKDSKRDHAWWKKRIECAQCKGNFLVELTQENEEQAERLTLGIEDKAEISKYLKVVLHQMHPGVLKKLEFIQSYTKRYSIYQIEVESHSTLFLFETKHVFETLSLRGKLNKKDMSPEFVSEKEAKEIKRKSNNGQNYQFNLEGVVKNTQDFLHLERSLNNSHNDLLQRVEFMSDNWEMFEPFYESKMQRLQDCISYYNHQEGPYQKLLPNLGEICFKAQKVNEYRGKEQHATFRRQNYLFQSFSLAAKKGDFKKELAEEDNGTQLKLIELGHEIAEWLQEIPPKKAEGFQAILYRCADSQGITNRGLPFRRQELSWSRIQSQKEQMEAADNERCIGCSPCFYHQAIIYNQSTRMRRPLVSGSVKQLKENEEWLQAKLKDMMLSAGGIILFDCIAEYFNIQAIGCKLSQKRRKFIAQSMEKIFKALLSQEKRRENSLEMRFIPVVKSIRWQQNKALFHLRNRFVTRVTVCKAKKQVSKPQQQLFQFQPYGYHFGPCCEPKHFPQQQIWPIRVKQPQLLYLTFIICGDLRRPQLEEILRDCKYNQSQYKLLSWLNNRKKKKGANKAEGEQVQDTQQLENWSGVFNYINGGFLLYHNINITQFKSHLQKQAQKRKNPNAQKSLSVKKVEEFILLEKYVENLDEFIIQWNKYNDYDEDDDEYDEQITIWEYDSGRYKDYYIWVQSLQKAAFVYCYFRTLNQKPKMQLPKGYESFQHTDVHQKFRLLCPKGDEGPLKDKMLQKFKQLRSARR